MIDLCINKNNPGSRKNLFRMCLKVEQLFFFFFLLKNTKNMEKYVEMMAEGNLSGKPGWTSCQPFYRRSLMPLTLPSADLTC